MQKVDRKKHNIPNHHIQVASVKGRPSNHEAASWQKQGKVNLQVHNCHETRISISKPSKSWKSGKEMRWWDKLVLKLKLKKQGWKNENICSSIYSTSSEILGTDLCAVHHKIIVVGPACHLAVLCTLVTMINQINVSRSVTKYLQCHICCIFFWLVNPKTKRDTKRVTLIWSEVCSLSWNVTSLFPTSFHYVCILVWLFNLYWKEMCKWSVK